MINETPRYPAVRPEIRTEIEAIEALLYDFILKIQENACELDQTAIVLGNYLDICESVRDKLLGLIDGDCGVGFAGSGSRSSMIYCWSGRSDWEYSNGSHKYVVVAGSCQLQSQLFSS